MDFIDKLKNLAHAQELQQRKEDIMEAFFDIVDERQQRKIRERRVVAKALAIANRAETINMAWVTAQLLAEKSADQLKRRSWVEKKTVLERRRWFLPAIEVEKTRLIFEGFPIHRSVGRYAESAQIVSLTLDEQEDRNHLAIYTTRQYSGEPDESTIAPLSHVPLEGNEPRWTIEDQATRHRFRFTNYSINTKMVVLGQGDRPYRGLFNSVNSGASNFEVYNQTHQELALQ